MFASKNGPRFCAQSMAQSDMLIQRSKDHLQHRQASPKQPCRSNKRTILLIKRTAQLNIAALIPACPDCSGTAPTHALHQRDHADTHCLFQRRERIPTQRHRDRPYGFVGRLEGSHFQWPCLQGNKHAHTCRVLFTPFMAPCFCSQNALHWCTPLCVCVYVRAATYFIMISCTP